jgi:FdhD protein
MKNQPMASPVTVLKFRDNRLAPAPAEVAVEASFTVLVNGREYATLMCTPSHLDELMVGLLMVDGLLARRDDILAMEIDGEANRGFLELDHEVDLLGYGTGRVITSGCGAKAYSLPPGLSAIGTKTLFPALRILEAMGEMEKQSLLWRATGGVHGAALLGESQIVLFRQDIGRHNAVDKVAGHTLLQGMDTEGKALLVTGRLSSEMIVKAVRLGVELVASRSGPTSAGVALAKDLGLTVMGFARGRSFNLYTHPERVGIDGLHPCAGEGDFK